MWLSVIFTKYICYLIIRTIFGWIQYLWWYIWGINKEWNKIKNNTSPNKNGVHVHTIIFRHKYDILVQSSDENNFITVHHSFQSLDYVTKPNVTLYRIDADLNAVFVETDENIDVTGPSVSPFIKQSQFYYAVKLIKVPAEQVTILTDQLGKLGSKVIFVAHTARCGGTLLCKVIQQASGKCAFLSDIDCLDDVFMKRKQWDKSKYLAHLSRAVSLMCKPMKGVDTYIVKVASGSLPMLEELQYSVPCSKLLFIYRNCIEVTQSLTKLANVSALFTFGLVLILKGPMWLTNATVQNMGIPISFSALKDVDIRDKFIFCVLLWADKIKQYRELKCNSVPVSAVKYEYLMENPYSISRAVLKYCDIPYDERAITSVLSKDSQLDSPYSKLSFSKYCNMDVTPERLKGANAVCDVFGVPRLKEECILPDTIVERLD